METKKKENLIKAWYKLAEPDKWIWTAQIFTYVLYTVFYTMTSYFAAFTINSLYEADWTMAFIYLAIEFAMIFLRNFFLHIEYVCYGQNHVVIRSNISRKLYNKIMSCDNKNFDNFSKEKIINIAINNTEYVAEFADTVAIFVSGVIQAILTVAIITSSNVWAGLIIVAIGIVNFFAYRYFNKLMGKRMNERYQNQDKMLQSYQKVIDGRSIINELEGEDLYEGEVMQAVEDHAKAYASYYKAYSLRENIYYICWNVLVYLTTALMIYFVSQGTLGMEAYLIIVPYLTTGTTQINKVFKNNENLEKMRVDVDRFNLILNLSDRELMQFGQMASDSKGYNLGLIDVSYQNDDRSSPYFGKISNVDISFMMNKINLIKGARGSGKRQIFNLLRRYIKPDKGVVLLDNLSLYDYSEASFKSQISYCSSHPRFLKGSIKENLSIVNKDFQKVTDVCKMVGVYDTIMLLPKGFDTDISLVHESSTLFLLGLARATLSDSKVLMIYEIPEDTQPRFRSNVKALLENYKMHKTILVFTHSDVYDDVADMKYNIYRGKITGVSVKGETKRPAKKQTRRSKASPKKKTN